MPELRFSLPSRFIFGKEPDAALLYADLREALHLGAKIIYDEEDALLLRLKSKYFAAGEGVEELPAFQSAGMVLVHEEATARRMMQQALFTECMEVLQFVCAKPCVFEENSALRIRPLRMDALPFVLLHYEHPNTSRAYVEARIKDTMLGAYIEDELCGFIGLQEEGAMGMLQVLPAFRHRGVARALQGALMQRLLQSGSIPYCHVAPSNAPSLALQRSMGLTACERPLFWLYKPV